ncbi:hypothetical protein [Mucilaginibacter endophyticus]|uniref:hypothetical protein n=1 Tax=Mucilaginibacter endophyticus TaxID=2675003 RepID=UPI000E0D7468|nr:hypothetical protein [Mucilaginibacter endophyticus]
MIITHETTIEEYEAWLATNPDFSVFKVAVRSTFRAIYKSIATVKRLVKKRKRSCLVYKVGTQTVYPLSYNKNSPLKSSDFVDWMQYVSEELRTTTNKIRKLRLFEFLNNEPWANKLYEQRLRRIEHLEDEIAMESLKLEVKELLSK